MTTDPQRDSAGPASAHEGALSRAGHALTLLLAVASATAWTHLALVFVQRHVLGQFSWAYWLRDQLLLSSIGYLLLFAAIAFVPIVIHAVWPRWCSWTALLASLTAIGTFSLLLLFDRISPVAWVLVAVGIAIQVHRTASRRPRAARRIVARIALVANLGCLFAVGATMGGRASRENAAIRSLPDAPADAPNVVLLILDTVRASSLSLHGAPWQTTPSLESRARDGVVFDAAYSTAPWTLPSHASMFTGRWPSHTTANWSSPLDEAAPTLAEAFRAHGYATGGFVANINIAGYRSGLSRGFIRYEDARITLLQAMLATTMLQSQSATRAMRKWAMTHWISGTARALFPLELRPMSTNPRHDDQSADDIVNHFLDWLPSTQGRPFLAFLNLFDAHGPMPPPMRYRRMFDSTANDLALYGGGIRYMDDAIERLLVDLDRRGVLDRTIVVITSDHGEQFGEHGLYMHGNSLYRPLLHVPLVVLNAPGAAAGRRVQRPVTLRDLPATLLDLASVPHSLPGTSMRPLLDGSDSSFAGSPVVSELSRGLPGRSPDFMMVDRKSLVTDSSHLIRTSKGKLEVYAYPTDPAEASDLGTDPSVRGPEEARLMRVLGTLGITWRP